MQDRIEDFRTKANAAMQEFYDELGKLWDEFNSELDRRSAIMRGVPALPNVADGPNVLGPENLRTVGASPNFLPPATPDPIDAGMAEIVKMVGRNGQ